MTKANKVTYCSVTYLSMSTCEGNGCPLYDHGCMAQTGNINLHAERVYIPDPVAAIRNEAEHIDYLTGRNPLRLRISGNQYNEQTLVEYTQPAAARYHRRYNQPVWTYDHNWNRIRRDAWGVISVLASVHSIEEIETARTKGYAAALLLPEAKAKMWKEGDTTIVHCPNERNGMLCIDCQLCWKAQYLYTNNITILFTPHGTNRKKILARYAATAVA